ncbi:diguanylate cyclase (GGDEF) domain-containing protein [Roseateles sp. YR242]|uniref:GGDEF domain-containing protein n=1 Tax=Roseateles sp. YR242 TaxID=1855305 RepID=UPI0008B3BF88|nr:GGDEF domain-containing protein [Roseateles sp. YR242]SEL77077.1 diguanylate cyclase (GGDEF) domain-containing protein [Roseateles sp. YR242]
MSGPALSCQRPGRHPWQRRWGSPSWPMRSPRHFVVAAALLLIGLAIAPGRAQAADAADRQLDIELAHWERLGFNEPAEALKALGALRALKAPQHPNRALRIDYTIGRVQAIAGDMAEAHRLADKLEQRAGGQPLAQMLRAEVQERIGQPVKAGELAQQAVDALAPTCPQEPPYQLTPACDWRTLFSALRITARALAARGEAPFAETRLRQALALAQAAPDTYATLNVMGQLAATLQDMDQPTTAQHWLSQAFQLAQGDPLATARMHMVESGMAARRKDPKAQLAALAQGLRLAEHTNGRREVASMQASLSDAYMHSHQPARAATLAREALPVVQAFGDQRLERTLRHNLSVALVLLRQFDAARRELNRVAALAQGDDDVVRRILQLRELGEAYAAVNQPREALRLYHEERTLSAEAAQRKRESALRQISLKYDSSARQRDLELARRQQALTGQELTNRRLAQYVGLGLAVLLGLSFILIGVMLLRMRDANKRLKANQRLLRAQSERDPLTDLANRRHFLSVMERQEGRDVFSGALLMIDIDHFKQINDRHGHAAGDAVIREIARRISHAVRAEDLVVRWGGEEFLVFARTVAPEALQHLAERILLGVGQAPVETAAGPLAVACSIGFAHFPLEPLVPPLPLTPPVPLTPLPPTAPQLPLHWEQAVNWADMALYTAKSQGRNRARGIVSVQAADIHTLLRIEADFEAACGAGQVCLQTILGPEQAVA